MDCSPPGSSVHGDSPGKNTGVGCYFLLQDIFPMQELNLNLLYLRQILYHLSPEVERKRTHKQKMSDVIWTRRTKWREAKNGARDVEICGIDLDSYPISSVQLLSRVQLFATPWTEALQASLSITNTWSLLKLMSIELVMPSNHLLLCRPLLLLPSIFPNIRVFSNESALHIRWPKYESFSFNISPSNELSGLIFLAV